MRRVQILRFFQALQIIARSRYERKYSSTLDGITDLLKELFREEGRWWKQLSSNRVKEIVRTIEECGLCKLKRNVVFYGKSFDAKWDKLEQALTQDLTKLPRQEWWATHKFLQHNHSVFSRFYDVAKKIVFIEPMTITEHLGLKHSEGIIHPTVSVLTEWELKLGRFQRNTLTGVSYVLKEPTLVDYPTKQNFIHSLCKAYGKVREEEKEYATSLPKVQEYSCESLQIARSKFNQLLEEVHLENLGAISLEPGIIPSYAYNNFGGSRRRKQVLKLDAIPKKLWFESTFSYSRKDWEDIEINGEVKRFIRIDDNFLRRLIDAKGIDSSKEA